MKTCFKCNISKQITEFYRHKGMADGHLNKCKDCAKNDVHQHRHGKGRSKVLEYDRARSTLPKRVALRKRVTRDWADAHPDRRSAQSKLLYAVRVGVVKKHPCFVCGENAVAHHPDYSAPLDVVWLCPAHHKQAHALVRP